MKVFGECFFYEYYLSIFVTATNKQIYLKFMKEYQYTTRVRYAETDQMGVVYHGNYAVFFEMGRVEWDLVLSASLTARMMMT